MKRLAAFLVFGAVLLGPGKAHPQTCDGVCVPRDDLRAFVQLAKEAKCRSETSPRLQTDPLAVVIDREGRIYGSGAAPYPYTVKLHWCNYDIEARGQVQILAAQLEEPAWGLRFRPKVAVGYLPATAFTEKDGYAGLDAGVLLEPFFLSWANVNVYVGARSVGVGLGADLTRNMGAYLGYATTWGSWQHNPHVALSFALW